MTAMSPRNPPPRLRSTSAENGEPPKKKQSLFQEVSLRRGYAVRAGKGRRERLGSYRGPMPTDGEWHDVNVELELYEDSDTASLDNNEDEVK